jgi:FtsP/CotA-like multicopper oxidase with cupredoxin domain
MIKTNGGSSFKAIKMTKDQEINDSSYTIPDSLVKIIRPDVKSVTGSRQFVMSTGMGGNLTINGKKMDMNRIDEKVPLGGTEIWEILNTGMGGMMSVPHSMHIHDVQFLIVDINGERPSENLRGWKDTVLLWPGDSVRLVASFKDYTGKYMYHCHLLEHEDQGMMGVFEVVN